MTIKTSPRKIPSKKQMERIGRITTIKKGLDCIKDCQNEDKIRELIKRINYPIIQENGQRKLGPPPDYHGEIPTKGCEVFVGKIPRDLFEDEIFPVFEMIGPIYELRLMMDFDGKNRGFCFVMFTERAHARQAISRLNNFEIRKGRTLGVCSSVDNCRLFVGGIPKSRKKEEIMHELKKVTEQVADVIVYPSAADKNKNRGFAFVEYETHKAAAMARRKLVSGRVQLWYGKVERVKKIRDYAFVHFVERDSAEAAMKAGSSQRLDGAMVEISFAKPVDKNNHNQLAKVGAKALAAQQQGMEPGMAQYANMNQPMLVYAGVNGFPMLIAQDQSQQHQLGSLPKSPIGPTRGQKARVNRAGARSSYLGYSAGKATYGRYYTKNTQAERMDASAVNHVEALEQVCQKFNWTKPFYQTVSTAVHEGKTMFLYSVTLYNLGMIIQAYKMAPSEQEAKALAAESALMQLGITNESSLIANQTPLGSHPLNSQQRSQIVPANQPVLHPQQLMQYMQIPQGSNPNQMIQMAMDPHTLQPIPLQVGLYQ
ncbi:Oidioi.mRNA.OKI2018_I69.XSR.g16569.t1.cds [Oikopleura dioica]|uniref:Oidioi.mRNA.OKI2018_I69.XSR.g16569.t1.cds n=1 Tax=Oikopleura dioica TaxID=34765 RepID=A0ABN7SGJ3_OIKDI|nr:Oidioi.mRNA.OKI2018_I69.XSR.g16569.t1.cds [Oikopleura dioica]